MVKQLNYRKNKLAPLVNEIRSIIARDEYIDGEISLSERFMREALEDGQLDRVIAALLQLYRNSPSDPSMMEGILVMISSVSYNAVYPVGQSIASELLSSEELVLRDRAIQCFEEHCVSARMASAICRQGNHVHRERWHRLGQLCGKEYAGHRFGIEQFVQSSQVH